MKKRILLSLLGVILIGVLACKRVDRQDQLMVAVRQADVETVKKLARGGSVDIYLVDISGESALTLAEKSGNAQLLEALAASRIPARDLERAQQAMVAGRSIGLQSTDPARGIERKITSVRQGGASRDTYSSRQTYLDILEEIKALPESARKEELLYTLASYQATDGFYNESIQTAMLMSQTEKRVELLMANGSNRVKDKDAARKHLLRAGADISQIQDATLRDSLYAQLAFAYKTRGFVEDVRLTCLHIQSPQFKNVTCANP